MKGSVFLDYESYFASASVISKEIRDRTSTEVKIVKKIIKCISDGDLATLSKQFALLQEVSEMRMQNLNELEKLTQEFDGQEYMSSGDFAEQMLEICNELDVDVQGSFPVYEMFPCKVTINPETQDVTVDRKRLSCLRPAKLVADIKTELDKLSKASFNVNNFAKELSVAYDLAILRMSKKKAKVDGSPVYLMDLYDYLTPMRRHKKEYTKHNFSFDLARLYNSDFTTLDNGRMLRFDSVRDNKKSIRILDKNGSEHFITTIRFISEKE